VAERLQLFVLSTRVTPRILASDRRECEDEVQQFAAERIRHRFSNYHLIEGEKTLEVKKTLVRS